MARSLFVRFIKTFLASFSSSAISSLPWLSRGLCAGLLFLSLAPAAMAQQKFALGLEEAGLSDTQKQDMITSYIQMRKAQHKDDVRIDNLQGSFSIGTACPAGFVQKANHSFSIPNIKVLRNEGTDCDGPNQCRAWNIEAVPEDWEQPYSFEMQLQCTDDQRAIRTGRRPELPAALIERVPPVSTAK